VVILKGAAAIESKLRGVVNGLKNPKLKDVLKDPSSAEIFLCLNFFRDALIR